MHLHIFRPGRHCTRHCQRYAGDGAKRHGCIGDSRPTAVHCKWNQCKRHCIFLRICYAFGVHIRFIYLLSTGCRCAVWAPNHKRESIKPTRNGNKQQERDRWGNFLFTKYGYTAPTEHYHVWRKPNSAHRKLYNSRYAGRKKPMECQHFPRRLCNRGGNVWRLVLSEMEQRNCRVLGIIYPNR